MTFGLKVWIVADMWRSEKVRCNLSSFARRSRNWWTYSMRWSALWDKKSTLLSFKRKLCYIFLFGRKNHMNAISVKLKCREKNYTGFCLPQNNASFFLFLSPTGKKSRTEICRKITRKRAKMLFAPQKKINFSAKNFGAAAERPKTSIHQVLQWHEH